MSEQNEPMRVDTEMVKTLARMLDENGLSEIEVEDDGRRIVVKRKLSAAAAPVVYAPTPAAPAPTPSSTAAPAPANAVVEPSVAVLPFADMSPEHDQEYFCDGMVEEIITELTRVPGLRVAARTSSFAFKHRADDVREIGRRLGVSTVLEGSVRKAGDRLRVTSSS